MLYVDLTSYRAGRGNTCRQGNDDFQSQPLTIGTVIPTQKNAPDPQQSALVQTFDAVYLLFSAPNRLASNAYAAQHAKA